MYFNYIESLKKNICIYSLAIEKHLCLLRVDLFLRRRPKTGIADVSGEMGDALTKKDEILIVCSFLALNP